jgi:hypothetical protein
MSGNYYTFHRESPATTGKPQTRGQFLYYAAQVVNFMKSQGLLTPHCETGSEHGTLLLYNELGFGNIVLVLH